MPPPVVVPGALVNTVELAAVIMAVRTCTIMMFALEALVEVETVEYVPLELLSVQVVVAVLPEFATTMTI
jgi:hypothetical protein